jgi:hypothetical protein
MADIESITPMNWAKVCNGHGEFIGLLAMPTEIWKMLLQQPRVEFMCRGLMRPTPPHAWDEDAVNEAMAGHSRRAMIHMSSARYGFVEVWGVPAQELSYECGWAFMRA